MRLFKRSSVKKNLVWLAMLAGCAAPASAVQFQLASSNGGTWTYTLTFDPEDNYCVQGAGCTATITMDGLYGVIAAGGPTSTDFPDPGASSLNLQWTPSVQNGGTKVVWSHNGGGTGNYSSTLHVYGFSITAAGAASGIAPVVTSQFCLDSGVPCTSRDIDTAVGAPVNSVAGSPAGSLGQVVSGGGWGTTFTLVNNGTIAATGLLSFYGNAGSQVNLPIGGLLSPVTSVPTTMNPGATVQIDSTGDPAQAPTEGWARLSTSGGIGGFAVFKYPAFHWEAVVPLETRNARTYFLAFDNTGSVRTGVAIANVSTSPAGVPVFINDHLGNRILTTTIMIPPLGHTSFMLGDAYPVTKDIRGTVEFDTPNFGTPVASPISIVGLRANGPALTTLPVLGDVDTNGGNMSQILFNGGFTNSFTLVNTGLTSATATLNFYGNDGSPLDVPLYLPDTNEGLTFHTLTRTLDPGASLLVQTVGQDSVPSVEGSAQLITTGNIGGFGIFRWTQYQEEASVPVETRNANSYVLAFDDTGDLTTGLALANLNTAAANIPVIIRNDSGAVLLNTAINLAAHGHQSFMLPDSYSEAAGRRGTVEFMTPQGGRISVIGLRARPDGTLTTIPVLAK